ncbi:MULTISPECIES: hypothetical protein [Achromobacter]|uniref:Uncharacterized protein n=1 Tax=Achromobacter spanius TaxID=217203 RepID=A0AA42S7G5_9BURK|nr:hypothetical protein [Achromobacter spanius]MDH0740365.1 hypothetical protein [Achromobacter spanius]
MPPITPLGKPLSQNPLMNSSVPLSPASTVAGDQPISAFQWVSLFKAAWTWIVRPLWYICFKWPAMMVLPSAASRAGREERLNKFWKDHNQQMDDEWRREYNDSQDRDRNR